MKGQKNIYFPIALVVIGISAVLLLFIFIPDMGATLIDTVPEFPPEMSNPSQQLQDSSSLISVNTENIKNVVAAMSRPDEYYSETKSVLSYSNGSATYFRRKWVKNGFCRVDLLNSSAASPTMHYLYADDDVYIWHPNDRSYYKTKAGHQDADDLQMLMSYEDIISADPENIMEAKHEVYDGLQCIYAEIRNPLLSYTQRYWISSSTGFLVYGETLDENGNTIYTIKATQTDISAQDDALFTLPDGKSIFDL